MKKTGIPKVPRRPEQRRTGYRAGDFLCPRCGSVMSVVVPAFDCDETPVGFELFFRCKNIGDCNCCVKVTAQAIEIKEEDCPGTEQSTIRLTAADAEKVFDAIENPPAPNNKLLAAARDYVKRLLGKRKS